MRISVFTGRKIDADREAAVRQAVNIAKEHEANLLLLPGNACRVVGPNGGVLQELANGTGVSILAEVEGTTFLFRPNKPRRQFYAQQFAFSKPRKGSPNDHVTHCKARKLIELLNNGNRVFKLVDKRIAVLLCGENNILRNVRACGNAVYPRYDDIRWPFDYDILVNPGHTSMGQWNLLHIRFAYFSRDGRTAIHCANNKHNAWKASLCVYQEGVRRIMGDLENDRMWATHIDPNDIWRMVTVEL